MQTVKGLGRTLCMSKEPLWMRMTRRQKQIAYTATHGIGYVTMREFRNYIFKARTVQLGSGPQALEEYSSLLRSNYATLTSSYHHPWMRKHGDDPWSWCADRAHECPSSDGDPCEGAHASFAQCPQASKRKTVSVERQLTVLQLGMLAGFWQNLKLPCE